jgi:predicted transcriptional regulator
MTRPAKRRRSGPTLPQAEREGVRLDIRVSEELAARIDEARGEMPRAVWVRDALRDVVTMDRIGRLREWAAKRIAGCEHVEAKLTPAWVRDANTKHQKGPPQALVEAWTERLVLRQVLQIIEGKA